MDIYPSLRKVVVENAPEYLAQCVALRLVERYPDMPRDVPVRKQIQLAAKQRLVIWGKHPLPARELPADERHAGIAIERRRGGFGERGKIGLRAQVAQQKEAQVECFGKDRGRMHSRVRHRDEGATILARGRGIHHDQRPDRRSARCQRLLVGERYPEVAAETRIGRCRLDREHRRRQDASEPCAQRVESHIGRHAARSKEWPARQVE